MGKHFLKQAVLWVSVLLSIIAIACFLLFSQPGLRFSFYVAAKLIPGKLEAKKLEGKILGGISAEKLYFENKDVSVFADRISLKLNTQDLLSGRAFIPSVCKATNIKINLKSSDAEKQVLTPNQLLASATKLLAMLVNLKDVQLDNILLQQDSGKSVNITNISIQSSRKNSKDVEALKVELRAPKTTALIQGSIDDRYNLSWKLSSSNLAPFSKNLAGSINCEGRIYGARQAPIVDVDLIAKRFEYANIAFASLSADAHLDLYDNNNSKFRLTAISPKFDGISFNRFALLGAIDSPSFKEEGFNFKIGIDKTSMLFPVVGNIQSVTLVHGTVQGEFNSKGLSTQTTLFVDKNAPILFELNLPKLISLDLPYSKQPFDGEIIWKTKELGFLETVLPSANNVRGNLDIKYSVSGTLEKPKFAGEAKLANGSLHIPALNIGLQDIDLSVNGKGNKIQYSGAANSDGKVLSLSGEAIYRPKGLSVSAQIKAEDFLLANTPEYKIVASSQMKLQTKDGVLGLEGKVFVPKAVIKPTYYEGYDSLPPEVVYVKSSKDKNKMDLKLGAKIQLELGDDVSIDIMGLKGKVSGQVQISDTEEKETTAVGSLHIKDANYTVYGQQLAVTKGNLHFLGGSVTRPEVDLEAIRTLKTTNIPAYLKSSDEDFVVGVKLQGRLDDPKIVLFSRPSGLSNPDILSYLIIGQPSAKVTQSKAQLLMQAAASLNLGGSNEIGDFVDRLQEKFGFSEFGFTEEVFMHEGKQNEPVSKLKLTARSSDSLATNAAFVLGKFLTPKIYVSYSQALLDDSSIFRVKYIINKHLSIQTEGSSLGGNAVDIVYSIEHD